MANLAMALDEIISKTKKMGSPRQVGGGGRRSAGRRIGGGGRGAAAAVEEPRTSARARFPQRGFVSGEVPAGRWKHDKFFETEGGAKSGARKPAVLGKRGSASSLGVGKATGGGIAARLARKAAGGGQTGIVKLQISNLPKSVLTSDLEELFQDFNCNGVTVHYDEAHNHLGTADLFTDQQSAKQILQEFKNIAIDGREIKFCIVAESGAAVGALADSGKKRSIHDRLHRVSGNPIQKRRRAMVVKKRVSGGAPKVGAAKAGKAGRKGRAGKPSASAGAGTSTAAASKVKSAQELGIYHGY